MNIDSDDLTPLYNVARKHQLTIVCGLEERDNKLSQTPLLPLVMMANY